MANNIKEADQKLESVVKKLKNDKHISMSDRHIMLFILSEVKDLLTTDEQIFISWSFEDVIHQGKSRGIDLTDDHAKDILQAIEKKHNTSIGINWNVIDAHLDFIDE